MSIEVSVIRLVATITLLSLFAGCAGREFKHPSLYQRLGGKGGLIVIVDGWLARAAADEKLSGTFEPATRDRIRPLLVDHLCSLVGGPCRYNGRDMQTAHAGIRIGPVQYDAMLDALRRSMTEYKIPEADQKTVFDLLKPLRKDIISEGRKGALSVT